MSKPVKTQEVNASIYRFIAPVVMERMRNAILQEQENLKKDYPKFTLEFPDWIDQGLDEFWFKMSIILEDEPQ